MKQSLQRSLPCDSSWWHCWCLQDPVLDSSCSCWAQGQCHPMSHWLLGEVWSRADPSLEWSCSSLLQRGKLPWESGGRKYNTKIMMRKSVCSAAVGYCDQTGESYWCDHLPHAGACGWGHQGKPGTPIPRPHIKACAFGYRVLFNWNEHYLVCVSCDSTVLAVLLSWSLSPCLEGLKVMGMDDFLLGKWWFGFG